MKVYANKILLLSCTLLVGLGIVLVNSATNMPIKAFSTYRKAIEVKKEHAVAPKEVKIVKSKKVEAKHAKILELKNAYYELYSMQPAVLANSLDQIEKKHTDLLTQMRTNGLKIDPITNLKPRLALAISYHLNLHVSDLSANDIHQLNFSNKEWYILKTFSESKDFRIMLKRNTLTSDFVKIDNLASIY